MRYNTRHLKFDKLLPGKPVSWLLLWLSMALPFFLGMPFSLWLGAFILLGLTDFLASNLKKVVKEIPVDELGIFSLEIFWPETIEYRFSSKVDILADSFWAENELELHMVFSPDFSVRHQKVVFMQGNAHVPQSVKIRPIKKGVLSGPEIFVCQKSRWGLFKIFYTLGENCKLVSIHPLRALSKRILRLPRNLQVTPVAILGGESQFHSMRHYFPGDSVRFINWKKTAATENVYLNLYEKEQNRQVYLLINTGMATHFLYKGFEFLDYALAIAWQVAVQILKSGDQTGIMTFDVDSRFFLEARLDKKQSSRIYHTLLKTISSAEPADFRQLILRIKQKIRPGAILLVFSPFLTVPEVENRTSFLDALYGKYNILWINPLRQILLDSQKTARLWRKVEDDFAEIQIAHFFAARKTELSAGFPETLLNNILKKYHYLKW